MATASINTTSQILIGSSNSDDTSSRNRGRSNTDYPSDVKRYAENIQRLLQLHIERPRAESLHPLRIEMVKEAAGPGVQRRDGSNILRAQLKVEHIQILDYAFFANRHGQDHDAALRQQRSMTWATLFLYFVVTARNVAFSKS